MDQRALDGDPPRPLPEFARRGSTPHPVWQGLAGLLIGGLLALGFAAHALPAGLAGSAWRLACLGYALVCLMRGVDRRAAAALFAVFLPFLAAVTIASVMVPTALAFADLARQLFIIGVAVVVFGAAQDPVARRVGLWALFVAASAILADALVRALPTLASGWSYAGARILKGKSFENGFNANELCFAALVGLVAGTCDRLLPRWVTLTLAALVGMCSLLLAARTPLLALSAGGVGGWLLARVPARSALSRQHLPGAGPGPGAETAAAALVIAGFLALFITQIDAIAHSAVAPELVGRAALWQIAVAAWPQHPLFGFGPGSFQAVIHANLGKAHFSTSDEFTTLYQLQAGGFHNLWLSVLVERGALGFAGVFASWSLLIGLALRLGAAASRQQRCLLYSLLISLFLRGQVELAGLFDDADGPINAMIVIALALTLPYQVPAVAARYRARDLAVAAALGR